MAANKVIFRAAGLLATLGLGVFIGVLFRSSPDFTETKPAVIGDKGVAALEALRSENLRLKAELARRVERLPDVSPKIAGSAPFSPIDQLRVMADLSKRQLLSPVINTFNFREAGVLSAAFVELFALTPPERATLQAAVDRARERVASLEMENATVGRAANGDVSINIRPFPQAGGAVYDELIKQFAEKLGPDRQSAFLVLAASQMEKSLGGLGTSERNLTFSRSNDPGRERPFTARESQRITGGTSTRSADFKTFEDMEAWAGTTARLLPKDFPPGK